MYVCLCHAVTDHEIQEAIRDGHTTAQAIMSFTRAGSGCGSCVEEIVEMAARGHFSARACHRADGKRHLVTLPVGAPGGADEAPPASAA
jgi:bacterioferritin-associated ferredoxin